MYIYIHICLHIGYRKRVGVGFLEADARLQVPSISIYPSIYLHIYVNIYKFIYTYI